MIDKPKQPNQEMTDETLSDLYRAMSTEESPESLDSAVLKMATQHQPESRTKPWPRRWAVPVSIAAVVVLSVSVITMFDFQSPDVYQLPEPATSSERQLKTAPAQDLTNSDHSRSKESAPLENMASSVADATPDSAGTSLATPKRKVKSKKSAEKPSVRQQASIDIVAETTVVNEPLMKKSINDPRSESVANKPNPAGRAANLDETIGHDDFTLTKRKNKVKQESPVQISAKPQPAVPARTKPAPAQVKNTSSPRTQGAVAMDSTPSLRQKSNTMQFSATPKRQQMEREQQDTELLIIPGAKTDAQVLDCNSLTHRQCLSSTLCILEYKNTELLCRVATNQCETGFKQQNATADLCEANSDCLYQPGHCICDVEIGDCECGEKGPPLCLKKSR